MSPAPWCQRRELLFEVSFLQGLPQGLVVVLVERVQVVADSTCQIRIGFYFDGWLQLETQIQYLGRAQGLEG